MKRISAPIWQAPLPKTTESRLRDIFSTCGSITLFFRADDIGKTGDVSFTTLMELFQSNRIPLCPAIVPTWINESVWRSYSAFQPSSSLWCWHQHGYSHTNHEIQGKKAEFGTARAPEQIHTDIKKGKEKLEQLLGNDFMPVFTPPWNRCSKEAIDSLLALGFRGLSRSMRPCPGTPAELPEFPVNVDLHTRKEKNTGDSWQALYHEMKQAARSGYMGIMLHHLLMNRESYLFLELMFRIIKEYRVPCLTFRELADTRALS